MEQECIKKFYVKKITEELQKSNDLSLLDLVYKILAKSSKGEKND